MKFTLHTKPPALLSRRIWLLGICLAFSTIALGWGIGRIQGAVGVAGNWFGFARQASPQPAQAGKGGKALIGNFDIRVNGKGELAKVLSGNVAERRGASSEEQLKAQVQTQGRSIQQGLAKLRESVPTAEVKISSQLAAVEMVRAPNGLTPPYDGQAVDIVRGFLRANKGIYGLTDADIDTMHSFGESVSRTSGLRMVRMEQMVNGRPIFQSETRFTLSRDGRLIRSVGLFVPRSGAAPSLGKVITAQAALTKAMASVGITLGAAEMVTVNTKANGAETEVVANDLQIAGNVPSRLVYFPAAPGVLIPAWSQVTFTNGEQDWYTLVDAVTGTVLWRKNIRNNASTHEARFRVYVQADGKTPADSPAPNSPSTALPGGGTQFPEILPTIVNMLTVQDIVASPNGWIDDCPAGGCTANETQTIGNNVHAYMDRVGGGDANVPDTAASSVLDGNGKPTGNPDANTRNRDFLGTTPRDFQTNFLPAPQGGNPEAGQTATGNGNNGTLAVDQFRRGVVTQLFYTSNWYHDQLYALGFDEAAANFQQTNFSGMGLGGDRVLAEAQDSAGTNNANFATPPDGMSGRMQMFRFTGPTVDRDGSLDAEIVIHELTHGTSNRLVGNGGGLIWSPGGGLGEGWSDFYALSLLNNTNADNPDGLYTSGAYATYKLGGLLDNYVYGIRRFPYSTDNTVNPMTWADTDDTTTNYAGGIPISPLGFEFGGAFEVHNIGEIWALSLWEVRSRIIAANGGNVPAGNLITLGIVTDAMKMTPINPTFTEARDALIDADCATNACANEASIWAGFADRGLGYNALSPLAINGNFNIGHQGLTESFQNPYLDLGATTINDTFGNNNGVIEPGEAIKITVNLKNPWRSASKNVASATATLTALTVGVVVTDANSAYGAIPAQGTAAGDTFTFTVPASATCGQLLKFTVQTNSALGASTLNLAFRVGQATGTGAPVTLTRTVPASGLNIPDNDPRGVLDTFTISQDMEIADLDFRVDSLTHTFTGDVTVLLKGPDGYGSDLIWVRAALLGGGDGNNFTNTVIDDQAVNDLNQSLDSGAPFTGSWLPAFNSPVWSLFGDPAVFPDPVGHLSYYNGKSTQGDWKVLVADNFQADSGKLNSWSLIVTPKTFSCAAFTPMVAVSGIKTVSGTFLAGNPITYTVTLTNNGALTQPDNAGNEFSDILPSQLTLVSASASSGTATTAGNTVNWNGSILAAGGTVTITINATINGNASGTVSNQGTISFDATADGSNESTAVTDDPNTVAPNDPTTFTVSCPMITLSALPGGAAGTGYNQTIVASPAAAYTYTQTAGALPPGLTLAANGTLSGTPTTVGAFTFTVTASLGACTGERTYTLVIDCPIITLAPTSFPNAEVGTAYNQTITASPAGGNYNYAVTGGFLPTGLTLNPATGAITGTPSQGGNFNFRVTVTGFGSCSTFRDYQILVPGCALITTLPVKLDNGTVGTAYSQTVSVAPPAAGAFTYSVTSGALPVGLSLDPATGVISGTPSATGSYSFRVTAALDGCSGSRDYTVVIGCETIALGPATIPAGQAGVAYSQTVSVTPAGSYTFSLTAGSLPSGLTLHPTTGVISGTPSVTGTSTFTVQALSASGCSGTQSYTLVIGCPTVTVNPASLPGGTTGTAYSQSLSASPAGGSYTFSSTGTLPAGLSLNPATGLLSGTPSANGTFTFTVTATGFGGCTGSREYTVTIGTGSCPAITLPASLPNGSVGTLYSNSATASPAGSYNYTAVGSLPPGTTLYNSIGLIFGYPTAAGSYTFTITATAGACSGSRQYTVLINAGFASSLTVFSDFDGDGKSDLSVFRGTDGSWLVANSGNGQLQSTPWGSSAAPYYDLAVSGDYDGDGKTDQAVFRRGTDLAGYWFIKRSSDGQVMRQQWGLGTDVPVAGDFDGDGKTDIAVWRGSAGAWYILRSSDGSVEGIAWGIASVGDIPVPGDYDGDFKTDVAVFRRSTGDWHIQRSSDGQTLSVKWGVGTDVAVPGDYDGDGKTDLAVWRPSEGNWYIIHSGTAAIQTVSLGAASAGDVPTAADYDGDGKADAAIWRASTGMWTVKRSSDNVEMVKAHGQSGDVPIMARGNN